MGRKRKASSRMDQDRNEPDLDVGNSRQRITTFEDVADSDDEFHVNRDKILLEEAPEAKRRRKWEENEEFLQPSDEEVLQYSDSEDVEGSEDEEDEDSQDVHRQGYDEAEEDGLSADEEDEGDEEGWGTSRRDIYGTDMIETEEQALEEEAEALRLQKKQLQSMTIADFGFDESEWQAKGPTQDSGKARNNHAVVTEVLPQLQINEETSTVERLKLLKSRYPEFEPLSKEFLSLRATCQLLDEKRSKKEFGGEDASRNLRIKIQAAEAYIGALCMYFALLTSPASDGEVDVLAMPSTQLREHPIMDTLFACRKLWSRANAISDSVPGASGKLPNPPSSQGNVQELMTTQESVIPASELKHKKSRKERHANALRNAENARKAELLERTEAGLADLDALVGQKSVKKIKTKQRPEMIEDDSDLGEEAPLTAQEAAEKAKHKKSLRFYTSQIAQKANKRGAAGRNAGGDDDIPYRERLKDRQARLNTEAERRARQPARNGEELGGESDEEDHRQARQIRNEEGSEDDYYDMVAARAARKKSDKATLAEAHKQASLQGSQLIQEETIGEDGKRKISYTIEKNKGLTPFRKKDVRNPRVKKRRKFDEKKKKLGSIKPIYKGGEGRGGYGGELTGIKKGLVKSTKL